MIGLNWHREMVKLSKPTKEAEAAHTCRTGVTQWKSFPHILHYACGELFIYTLFVFKTVQVRLLYVIVDSPPFIFWTSVRRSV